MRHGLQLSIRCFNSLQSSLKGVCFNKNYPNMPITLLNSDF